MATLQSQVDILLVEDNPNDIELTIHAFKRNNLVNNVHVVRDGAEAIDFLLGSGSYTGRDIKNAPRVILLDLKLPGIDGLDVLQQIKKDPRTSIIPVVMLTSSHLERDIIESYRLGVNSYIVKPVNFEKFIETVRNLGLYWLLVNEPPAVSKDE
jgi:two-component system, response regulator